MHYLIGKKFDIKQFQIEITKKLNIEIMSKLKSIKSLTYIKLMLKDFCKSVFFCVFNKSNAAADDDN